MWVEELTRNLRLWCFVWGVDRLTRGLSLMLCGVIEWVSRSGLSLDGQGFIEVNDYLQSTSHPNVFAGTSDTDTEARRHRITKHPFNSTSSHTHIDPRPPACPNPPLSMHSGGDIASMLNHPRPKAGVFAVRHGPPLADNLRRRLTGHDLTPFTPQVTYYPPLLDTAGLLHFALEPSHW